MIFKILLSRSVQTPNSDKNWQASCPLQTFVCNISRHLEFIIEQGHWVSGSLDSRVTGSLGHKMWPSSMSDTSSWLGRGLAARTREWMVADERQMSTCMCAEEYTILSFTFVENISFSLVPRGRVAGEGRRVVAPPCPRSTARLQSSPVGRVESFRSGL